MFKGKIITGNWAEGTLEVSGMPKEFVLSARNVVVLEEGEYEKFEVTVRNNRSLMEKLLEHGEALTVLGQLKMLYHLCPNMKEPEVESVAKSLMKYAEERLQLAKVRRQSEYIEKLKCEIDELKELSDMVRLLEEEAWDLVCIDVPTGGDDYYIQWRIIGHFMDKPKTRVLGYGKTPLEAIKYADREMKVRNKDE